MNILVTGANGFIGKNLVATLKIYIVEKTKQIRTLKLRIFMRATQIRLRIYSMPIAAMQILYFILLV